jgi:hypothetical protein
MVGAVHFKQQQNMYSQLNLEAPSKKKLNPEAQSNLLIKI